MSSNRPSNGSSKIPQRRSIKATRYTFCEALLAVTTVCLIGITLMAKSHEVRRPNILLAISDDQSWPHAGAYGDKLVSTPAFDRLASGGVLFQNAFCPASQCSPSRASLLSGLNIWQLEEAGTQASYFPTKFKVYPRLLEQAGYHVGYTGKPWGPGNWKEAGWARNPTGTEYNRNHLTPPTSQISSCDYSANFAEFLDARPAGAPFCFWFGAHEPHRNYEPGSGVRAGKSIEQILLPSFYPDNTIIRSDLADYYLEIEWFDRHLGIMLDQLERTGELEKTLIAVTSDNGMPFPRAKATLYEAGSRIPLVIQWQDRIPGGRILRDLVSLVDLAPTFLEAAGIRTLSTMTGRSLLAALTSVESGWVDASRDWVVLGKERHNHARPDNLGYPTRAIRTKKYLYIRNLKPDRWPMGDPPGYFCHTKMINPTKELILDKQNSPQFRRSYEITYAKRPFEELYDIEVDPNCLENLAPYTEYNQVLNKLRAQLDATLKEQGDPRTIGNGAVFESYPYFGRMQPNLSGFKERGQYNPAFLPPGYPRIGPGP